MGVLYPLVETEGAGANGRKAELIACGLRRDRRELLPAAVTQQGEQRAVRLVQHEVHGVVVDDLHGLDRGHLPRRRRLRVGIRDVLDVPLHDLGVELFAVVELDALPELEGDLGRFYDFPRLRQRQRRVRFAVPVVLHEAVEHRPEELVLAAALPGRRVEVVQDLRA